MNLAELAQADANRRDAEARSADAADSAEAERWKIQAVDAVREFFDLDADVPVVAYERAVHGPRRLWEATIEEFDLAVRYQATHRGSPWTIYRRERTENVQRSWIPAEELRELHRPADLIETDSDQRRRAALVADAEGLAQNMALAAVDAR